MRIAPACPCFTPQRLGLAPYTHPPAHPPKTQLGLTPQAALSAATLPTIKTILSYHIVPNVAATAASLTNGQVLPTLDSGESLTVRVRV